MEHVLERFRVPFSAMRTGKGASHLQRNNLVFWFIDGRLDSIEVLTSAHHGLSDLVNWCDFDPFSGDLLGWCAAQGIPLTLMKEEDGGQLWEAPSGALAALQDGQLWNVTLTVHSSPADWSADA
ncbi:hypothetical protein [Deinococcus soli (ex Cha et al. 2016)]|uniref:Uncharacterized protein n=1 Tax=Deinococcus soli (ex Cha et al. 2016) TaxID=1309411 RepID=A0A0F7JNS7_9DEIO|nr:hypothetical protein [Deinococcus soli (ex Cha et al. 2016)]AKH16270.1 hypothetical protein SY84_03490 [Deinococcus soli (ex Cha et al. 2016)]